MLSQIICRPNVGMWRYRRVEMLENGNVGLLRCLIVEKWRSLVALRCFNCSSFVACFFCIDYIVK